MAYRKGDQPTSRQADTRTLVSAALIPGKILPNIQDSDDELVTKDTPNKTRNEIQGDCRIPVNINFTMHLPTDKGKRDGKFLKCFWL